MTDDPGPATVHCSRCGRSRADAAPADALAWAMTHDERGRTWLCPGCTRAHTRDIEGKLPDEYW
jgi:transposase